MSGGKDNQEPSMEEILSSIRRIIADEQEEAPPPAAAKPVVAPIRREPEPPPPPPPSIVVAEEEDEEELELTEILAPPPPPRPEPPPIVVKRNEEPVRMPSQPEDGLISGNAASASTSALARLSRAMSSDEKPAVIGNGVTVEQLVMELLRPQLKEWLDTNLPAIVERVVEQEVKKLARRAELL